MDNLEAEKILKAFDTIAGGKVSINDLISRFEGDVPNGMRELVTQELRRDIAKSLQETVAKSVSEVNRVMGDEALMAKLKEAGGEEEPVNIELETATEKIKAADAAMEQTLAESLKTEDTASEA